MAGHAALLCAQTCLIISGNRVLVYHSVAGAPAAALHRAAAAVLQVVATRVPMALHAACVWLGAYATCGSCGPAACGEGMAAPTTRPTFLCSTANTHTASGGGTALAGAGVPVHCSTRLGGTWGWFLAAMVMCDCHPACPYPVH